MKNNELFLNLNSKVESEKILWIQGPGGNTSIKEGNRLLVKASGTRIRDLRSMDQLAEIQLSQLQKVLLNLELSTNPEESYKHAIESNAVKNSLRPSMESGFHAWLPQQFVFHFHSLAGIGLAELASQPLIPSMLHQFKTWYQNNWEKHLGPLQIIDSCLPGYQLTFQLAQKKPARFYLLRNHGVILAFDDPQYLDHYKNFESEALQNFMPNAWNLIQKWQKHDALELVKNDTQLLEAELKFFFPDMAIMSSRIQKNLTPTKNGNFRFEVTQSKSDESPVDLDALENWLACSMLQKLFPTLPTLTQFVCDQINLLPTEVARKKVMEPNS